MDFHLRKRTREISLDEIATTSTEEPTDDGSKRMRIEELLSLDPNEHSVAIEAIEPSALLEIQLEDDQNEDTSTYTKPGLEGKRIIDIYYFFQKLQEIALHNIQLGCAFKDLNISSESTDGLKSQISLYCNNCESNFSINLTGNTDRFDINSLAISSAEGLQMGFNGMKRLLNSIGIPMVDEERYEIEKNSETTEDDTYECIIKQEIEDPD